MPRNKPTDLDPASFCDHFYDPSQQLFQSSFQLLLLGPAGQKPYLLAPSKTVHAGAGPLQQYPNTPHPVPVLFVVPKVQAQDL